jgi:hypothetical protein
VLAEELGPGGRGVTLALFIALVWRSFWIAQLAARAGLKFQSYLAAGFGLWLGAQALINIGVNMGVLPTKGLTLPLMSYGRSSMIVTLAWVGCCCACITRPCRARAAWRPRAVRRDARPARSRRRSMSARAPILIMAAAPAATCSRRSRSRACCAPLARSGVARHEARARGARRAAGEHRHRVARDERPARQGRAHAAGRAVQARAVDLAGAGDHAPPQPALVVGFGGFVTGPAASRPGSRAGRSSSTSRTPSPAIRIAASRTSRAACCRRFPRHFPPASTRGGGNPVRAEIVDAAAAGRALRAREGALRLLVVGGSLGASRLNAVVPFASSSRAHAARAPPGRRTRHRTPRRKAPYAEAGASRRRRAVHRRHGAGYATPTRDLPRRWLTSRSWPPWVPPRWMVPFRPPSTTHQR